ncbi:MAG: hypothetical protein HQ522_15065 [Bacteroidetes bacterium]|nr:hypothetical protein [Bacteroidota bacterium]
MGRTHKVIEKDGTFMGEGEIRIDMSGMKPGMYFFVGNDEKGSVDRIKITKTNLR